MSDAGFEGRLRALLAGPAVLERREPSGENVAIATIGDLPLDLRAFDALSGGLALRDGTTILGREERAQATRWLVEEKSLDWPEELRVVGEREDLVIVRDPDRRGARAGGGVLEAPTDGLSSFKRIALDLVGYLELRCGVIGAPASPEVRARHAMRAGDAAALGAAIEAGFYPGAERDLGLAAQKLAELRAAAGDEEGALVAFERAVEARVKAAPRGAASAERAAAWRAAATIAAQAGAPSLAARCKSRGAAG
ncbi:MAG: hypothetical protein U0359_12280 [Byssovorax sp.]